MKRASHINLLKSRLLEWGAIPPDAWAALAASVRQESYRADRYLPIQPEAVYYLASGLVKEEVYASAATDHIQRFIQPGDFIVGEQQAGNGAFVTLYDTTLISLSAADSHALFGKHPMLGRLYVRLLRACHTSVEQRLRLLLLPKRDRYAAFTQAFPGLAARLLDKDIMRYLDISPGYFSRSKG